MWLHNVFLSLLVRNIRVCACICTGQGQMCVVFLGSDDECNDLSLMIFNRKCPVGACDSTQTRGEGESATGIYTNVGITLQVELSDAMAHQILEGDLMGTCIHKQMTCVSTNK